MKQRTMKKLSIKDFHRFMRGPFQEHMEQAFKKHHIFCEADLQSSSRKVAYLYAPIALQRGPRPAYFQGFVHRFVGRVLFGLWGGADTIQPPL